MDTGTSARRAFTLVEVLVTCVILMFILVVTFGMINQTGKLWRSTNNKISAFQNARAAFEAVARNLGQATVNQYLDYYDSNWKRLPVSSASKPAHYGRYSELEYVSGQSSTLFSDSGSKVTHAAFFQAPVGKSNDGTLVIDSPSMMNGVGYFVEFGPRSQYDQIPKFIQASTGGDPVGFRLIEWVQASENLEIYDKSYLSSRPPWAWFVEPVQRKQSCRVLAENVIALIILPKSGTSDTSLTSDYFYDSSPATYTADRSYLLPPMVQLTLVSIDEDSAQRLRGINGTARPPLIPNGAFQNVQNYAQDLKNLEDVLRGGNGRPRLEYRIFSTTISTKPGS